MVSRSDISRFNLQLPVRLKRELENAAGRTGQSLAGLVRSALEDFVRRENQARVATNLRRTYGDAVRPRDLALVEAGEGSEWPIARHGRQALR